MIKSQLYISSRLWLTYVIKTRPKRTDTFAINLSTGEKLLSATVIIYPEPDYLSGA